MAKECYVGIENPNIVELPNEYKQLAYITTNDTGGVTCIDTGYMPSNNTRIVCDVSGFSTSNTNQFLFGAAPPSSPGVGFFVPLRGGYYGVEFGNTNASFDNSINYSDRMLVDYNNNGLVILNGKDKINISSSAFTVPISLLLFATTSGYSPFYGAQGVNVHDVKIYESGVLVRHYVPCKNWINNTVGMYETVESIFYEEAYGAVYAFEAGGYIEPRIAARTKRIYIGVGDVARKVTKGYIGIDGVARLFYQPPSKRVVYYGEAEQLSEARKGLAAVSSDQYAFFAGGQRAPDAVDAYDAELTHKIGSLQEFRYDFAATTLNGQAMFAGGSFFSGTSVDEPIYPTNTAEVVDNSMTSSVFTLFSSPISELAAASNKSYALCGGGTEYQTDSYTDAVVAIEHASGTQIMPTGLYEPVTGLAAASNGDIVFFAFGEIEAGDFLSDTACTMYNSSLEASFLQDVGHQRTDLCGINVGEYVLFAGGSAYRSGATSSVTSFNRSGTTIMVDWLSTGRYDLAATHLDGFAIIAGGNDNNLIAVSAVDIYDASLTHTIGTSLPRSATMLAATTIGKYALYGGGTIRSSISPDDYVYAYTTEEIEGD